jgi:dTDP-4-dehydrorhamnose reductase
MRNILEAITMFIGILGSNSNLGIEISRQLSLNKIPHANISKELVDITNEIAVSKYLKTIDFTHIVNCAAYTNVAKAELEDSNLNYQINHFAIQKLAQACKRYNRPLLHFSTDYVYPGLGEIPQSEATEVNPLNHYGKAKLFGDIEVVNNLTDYKILRIQSLYSATGKSFLTKVYDNLKTNNQACVFDDQFTAPCSVTFIAKHVVAVLKGWKEIDSGVYNLSHSNYCSWFEYAKYFCKVVGLKPSMIKKISYKKVPQTVVRPNYSLLDSTRIKKALKIEAYISRWESDLESFYINNRDFYKRG